MGILLLKLALAPALVTGATLVGRRWGPRAGGIMPIGVVAFRTGGSAFFVSDAAREQQTVVGKLVALDLTRQPGGTVDLAPARVAVLALRGSAQAVLGAAVAIAAVRRSLAARHADVGDALQLAAAVTVVRTERADRTVATRATAQSENHERDQ